VTLILGGFKLRVSMLWCLSHLEVAHTSDCLSKFRIYKNILKAITNSSGSYIISISAKTYSVENTPHIPNRTIRRVHVMPWATPIRRIGLSQSGKGKGDIDDSDD
jgi:hypothetical protein